MRIPKLPLMLRKLLRRHIVLAAAIALVLVVLVSLFGGPLSLFLDGQYQGASDFEITPTTSFEYSAIGAQTGLRWNF